MQAIKACVKAFGAGAIDKMIKPHMFLHASDQWESNGPIKDGGGADQQAEAKQADVKSAAAWTNMQHGQEGAIGRVVHRRDVVLKRARVKGMQNGLICDFARVGQLHELSLLLSYLGGDPDGRDADGVSALSHASEQGHAECARLLLGQGADANTHDKGATPLILACMEGHGAVVDVLLAAGAKTDCLHLKLTAVQWAHRNGHAHCRAKLQSGSDAAPPMPRPDQCGPSIEVDQSTNRLGDRAKVRGQSGLTRRELDVSEAAQVDGFRLQRLLEKLATFLGISMYDAQRRVKPLRLYSHIVFRASDDPEVASCHGIAGASCFWNGNEAPEYVGVAVSDPEYDDEYKGELLLCFEVTVEPVAGEPQLPPQQLCYIKYLEYAPPSTRPEPFEAFVYSEDDQDAGRSGEPWCKVHRISDVRTRVPLMPLFTCDAEAYDENRLYDVTDMHGYEAQDLL